MTAGNPLADDSRGGERWKFALAASELGVWDWTVQTGEVYLSDRLFVMLGYAPGEFPQQVEEWRSRLHPDDMDRTLEAVRDQLEGRTPLYEAEYRMRTKDGSYRWILDRGKVVVRDAGGTPLRMAGTLTDITEQKQAEGKLREQAALLDQARDAILVRDLNHRIHYWNRGAERLYGWKAEEVEGRSIKDLLYPDPTAFLEAVEATLKDGEWGGEVTQTTKDGRKLTVQAHWSLVRDWNQRPEAILAINTDVTEKKKLEQQFLRAQRMESIGTLAGGIAHDLNNVLGPIIMSLDLLRLRFTDDDSRSLIDIVQESAGRGAAMVSQVLSFARGVDGERVEVQVNHVIREIEKIANDTFLKNIQVRTSVPAGLRTILGDPTQLHQVLLNLCVNARDAMPAGGTMTISAENIDIDEHYAGLNLEAKPGPYIRLEVEDTGSGMPPEITERIFDPFFTTKAVGKGTGLGLSTSLAIVKSHGGFIRVASQPGSGTRFEIFLPSEIGESTAAIHAPAMDMPRGHGELILVVDDEQTVREITRRTLEAFGYRVVLATDGSEAIVFFAERRAEIDAVITDMMMPGLDGLATIQILRRMDPKLPIMVASGVSSNDDVSKVTALGIHHFLPKPYTASTMLKSLQEILAER